MQFRAMTEGSADDFRILQQLREDSLRRLPDRLLSLLEVAHEDRCYNATRGFSTKMHCLQAATRALRDGADEEMIVVALLHDLGESLGPMNHGDVIAAILEPFISADNHWLLKHHPVFQGYFYFDKLGLDPDARERYRDHPMFEPTAEFCARWDQTSFDERYDTLPVEAFEPMLRSVLGRPATFGGIVADEP
jgi:predicted HD phosphohydrolase